MGGFIAAELAIQFPKRVERLVLVSAAGLLDRVPARRAACSARCAAARRPSLASAGCGGARSDALAAPPAAAPARCCMRLVATPTRLPAPLIAEQVRGAGKPGFLDALDALIDYRSATASARSRARR